MKKKEYEDNKEDTKYLHGRKTEWQQKHWESAKQEAL